MNVSRKLFFPIPKVDSAVLRIEKYEKRLLSDKKEKLFIAIVKSAFKQKRKTLANNLHQGMNISKNEVIAFLETQGFDDKVRAEQLDIKTFIKIAEVWPYDY